MIRPAIDAVARAACIALPAMLAACPAQAASVEVVVDGIEPAPGTVYVALCQGGLSGAACRPGQDAPAAGRSRRFVVADVTAGGWAVAAYQDINGNGRLDRTGLGLPTEPYGFSGGAGRRARPGFADARIAVSEPATAVRVRLARAAAAR